jgi:hypothetical protein
MADDQHAKTDDRTEFLLNLNSGKVNRLESALENNWIAHLILAGIGVAMVFDIAKLPTLIVNYFTKGDYDKKAAAAIILAVLLYYFMKLGYLLTSFVDASQLQEDLLRDYLREQFEEAKMMPLRKSTNFFVEAFSAESFKIYKWFSPYLLVTLAVVSVAQAAALFSIVQAYDIKRQYPSIFLACGAVLVFLYIKLRKSQKASPKTAVVIGSVGAVGFGGLIALAIFGWSPGILLFCVAVLVILYILFWDSQKDRPQTTWVVLPSAWLAVGWLLLFTLAGR